MGFARIGKLGFTVAGLAFAGGCNAVLGIVDFSGPTSGSASGVGSGSGVESAGAASGVASGAASGAAPAEAGAVISGASGTLGSSGATGVTSGTTSAGASGNPSSSGSPASGNSTSSGGSGATTGSSTGSTTTGFATGSSTGSTTTGSATGSSVDSGTSGAASGSSTSSTPPSCQTSGNGLTNCGASSESCCTSLPVTGGTYYRTYPDENNGVTANADPATVSSFRLDKYDVTVGRFRQFVAAWNGGNGWLPTAGSGKHTHLNGGQGLVNSGAGGGYEPGWNASDNGSITPTSANLSCGTWTATPGSNENQPITCVNWWESYAFCIWDGDAFLPSEAEWEYASAGGSQQRAYPWGANDPGAANQYAIYGCNYPGGRICSAAPVGTAASGAGLYGQLDLAGNAWQWNLDWFAAYTACTDCADTTASNSRVYRGGIFDGPTSDLRPESRNLDTPALRFYGNGFRCARTP